VGGHRGWRKRYRSRVGTPGHLQVSTIGRSTRTKPRDSCVNGGECLGHTCEHKVKPPSAQRTGEKKLDRGGGKGQGKGKGNMGRERCEGLLPCKSPSRHKSFRSPRVNENHSHENRAKEKMHKPSKERQRSRKYTPRPRQKYTSLQGRCVARFERHNPVLLKGTGGGPVAPP